VTLSVPMLVLIQNWSLRAAQLTSRQTATLEVCGEVGGVIRHQQRRQRPRQSAGEAAGVNRWQRTKTSCLVRRHVNAHICSSENLTRISKVKIPNSNSNSNINFEVRLTSLIKVSRSLCVLCSKLYNAHQRPAVAAVHSGVRCSICSPQIYTTTTRTTGSRVWHHHHVVENSRRVPGKKFLCLGKKFSTFNIPTTDLHNSWLKTRGICQACAFWGFWPKMGTLSLAPKFWEPFFIPNMHKSCRKCYQISQSNRNLTARFQIFCQKFDQK